MTDNIVSEIKHDVPLPPQHNASTRTVYPFAMMLPGDMFETDSPSIAMVAKAWAGRHNLDWKFATRYLGKSRSGLWRVK